MKNCATTGRTGLILKWRASRAFTLAEVMIATFILTVAVTMAVRSYIYLIRQWRQREIQETLDIQIQKSMERLKNDLRLSGLEEMVFYPAGNGPYTAVSMAMARDDNPVDGIVEVDANNNIIWDYTIIYHVWPGEPNAFRRTVIDPRDNTMTTAQLYTQLVYVVSNGSAMSTYSSTNTTTNLFQNLVDFELDPQGAVYDAYSPNLGRDVNTVFGSAYLPVTSGFHKIRFSVIGKNDASSGYQMGVDTIFMSPSSSIREAETQTVVEIEGGVTPTSQNMSAVGSWSGNWQLHFPATASGQCFTVAITNDQWHETNFKMGGQDFSNTEVVVVTRRHQDGYDVRTNDPQYAVRIKQNSTAESGSPTNNYWSAMEQLGYASHTNSPTWPYYEWQTNGRLTNAAIRVIVKGSEMAGGGFIPADSDSLGYGNYGWVIGGRGAGGVEFYSYGAYSNWGLKIEAAFIAECLSNSVPFPDIQTGSSRRLTFSYNTYYTYSSYPSTNCRMDTSAVYNAWQTFGTDGTNIHIDKSKSYAITYLVSSDTNQANLLHMQPTNNGMGKINCYYIPCGALGAPNTTNLLEETNWSQYGSAVMVSSNIIGIRRVWFNMVSNGLFTSGVFDTLKTTPVYGAARWDTYQWPAYGRVGLKIRTAANSGMTGAVDWSSLPWDYASPYSYALSQQRYVQFQAYLEAGSYAQFYPYYTHMYYIWGPLLNSVTIPWTGDAMTVDVGGTMTKNTNYGTFVVTVNSNELVKGLTARLEIFADAPLYYGTNRELSSRLATEVLPRNSGR